jgi:hypothetical protein
LKVNKLLELYKKLNDKYSKEKEGEKMDVEPGKDQKDEDEKEKK